MRIKSLNIIDFGKFQQSKEFTNLNQKLVIFCGNNEAGKTTLFHLIKTLLYGFSPAKLEQHPYSSWENERIEFSALIEAQGEEIQLYRRLLSSPKGEMVVEDRVVELKNQPAPFANHISSEIYNRIYSLRIEDLTELEGKAWDQVQDKLLANYGNTLIKDTKSVLRAINEEASQLYRTSGRGKYRVKELEEAIKALKKERVEAKERQELLRNGQKNLWRIKEEADALTKKKIRLKILMKKAGRAMLLYRLIKEQEALQASLENPAVFEKLPADGVQRLAEQEQRIQTLEEALRRKVQAMDMLVEKQYIFSPQEEHILNNQTTIEAHYQKAIRLGGLTRELHQLEQELIRLEDRQRNEARNLFSEELSPQVLSKVQKLNIPAIRIYGANYQKTKGQLQEIERLLLHQRQLQLNHKPSRTYIAPFLMGFSFLGLGIYYRSTPLLFGSVISMLYGVVDFFINKVNKRREGGSRGLRGANGLTEEQRALTQKLEDQRKEIYKVFDGIPVSEVLLENMEEMLLTHLVRLRDYLFEWDERKRQYQEKKELYQSELNEMQRFLQTFQESPLGQVQEKIESLRQQCQELVRIQHSNHSLGEMKKENEAEQNMLREEKENLLLTIKELSQGLRTLGEGDLETGKARLIHNQRLLMKINMVEEKLQTFEDLRIRMEELRELQQENPTVLSEEAQSALEMELEALEESLQYVKEQEKELTLKNQSLLEKTPLDEIESSLMNLELEREEVLIRRDQLILLEEIIKRADESFREENQPDVLKNASVYFNKITGGRYTHIYLEEEGEETHIRLREKGSPAPRRISESFSKGTLNQLFLSLRLSLIDHLDQRREALPICFDELLINFDEERLDHYLELLKEVSKKRQIFIFTCHQWFAEKLKGVFDVDPIQL